MAFWEVTGWVSLFPTPSYCPLPLTWRHELSPQDKGPALKIRLRRCGQQEHGVVLVVDLIGPRLAAPLAHKVHSQGGVPLAHDDVTFHVVLEPEVRGQHFASVSHVCSTSSCSTSVQLSILVPQQRT